MEEASKVRSVDASALIGDRMDDSSQNDISTLNSLLQSDRGSWQLTRWLCFTLIAFSCSWCTFLPAFLVPVSDCTSVSFDPRTQSSPQINASSILLETSGSADEVNNCYSHLMRRNCSRGSTATRTINDSFIVKCTSAENTEFQDISDMTVVFYGTKGHVAAFKYVYMFGSTVAIILMPFIVNRYGQRRAFLSSFLSFVVCVFLTAFQPLSVVWMRSTSTFLAFRFFSSMGITSMYWIALQAMLESVVPRYRQLYGVIGYLGWTVGYMILPAVAWYTAEEWDKFQVFCVTFSLLAVSLLCNFPESVVYLLRRGEVDKAIAILKKAIRKDGGSTDDVNEICHQSYRALTKRRGISDKNGCFKLKSHLECRNLIFYASSFVIAFLYYTISWDFYLLPGDPFMNFACAGAMETLAVLALAFIGSFADQKLLLFLMAMGTSIFPVAGIMMATGNTVFPLHSYMAAKFFVTGAVILTVIDAFGKSSLTVTAAVMSFGAALASLLDEMTFEDYNYVKMNAACISCLILGILYLIFPCILPNDVHRILCHRGTTASHKIEEEDNQS